ncbi:MAG: rRNA maturation RNase YbeY [Hyphomicrobiaceae bacterium TMED74]|nr:rRNA maturation RNase YbeY [Filomicrobium sp.]RPG40324.1 MAG: rRNA maturation RNase YbeY [Hyphomicrobiaceae bacterium TMED74]
MTDSSDGSAANQVMASQEDEEPDQRLTFDVVTQSGDWRAFEPIASHLQSISKGLVEHLRLPAADCQVCLALCSDDAVQAMNAQYRAKDYATNVLSYPAMRAVPNDSEYLFLGDLAIADHVLLSEAEAMNISPAAHFSHIVLHGVLHLLSFDHIYDQEASEMEALETEILAKLGIADPYAEAELEQA